MAVDHVIPFFSFIAMLAVLLPAGPHIRARNSGTLLLIAWLFISNLNIFVNALAWWSSTENRAAIWCDISTKLTVAVELGVPCANLCIAIRLESIASTRVVSISTSQRRRRLYQDLAIGLLLPLIFTVLSVVSQGHRFDIIEGIGCYPAFYVTIAYVCLVIIPQMIVCFVSLTFSLLALRQFYIHQKQFSAILRSSGSNMSTSRYTRLMLLTITDLVFMLPIVLLSNIKSIVTTPLAPYTSWADVHADFGAVLQLPASVWELPGPTAGLFPYIILTRWVSVVCAFIFFAFFGLSVEARQQYVLYFKFVTSPCRSRRNTKINAHIHDLGRIEASSFGTNQDLSSAKNGSISGCLPYEMSHQASFLSEAPSSPGARKSPRIEISVQRNFD